MAEGALFDGMEVCLGALMAVRARILGSYNAGFFVNNFLSCYRSTTGTAVVIRLVAGEAQANLKAYKVIEPVPRYRYNR